MHSIASVSIDEVYIKGKGLHLFAPVLNALLTLVVTLATVNEEESDQGSKHAAEYADADYNIHPNWEVLCCVLCNTTDKRSQAIVRGASESAY